MEYLMDGISGSGSQPEASAVRWGRVKSELRTERTRCVALLEMRGTRKEEGSHNKSAISFPGAQRRSLFVLLCVVRASESSGERRWVGRAQMLGFLLFWLLWLLVAVGITSSLFFLWALVEPALLTYWVLNFGVFSTSPLGCCLAVRYFDAF